MVQCEDRPLSASPHHSDQLVLCDAPEEVPRLARAEGHGRSLRPQAVPLIIGSDRLCTSHTRPTRPSALLCGESTSAVNMASLCMQSASLDLERAGAVRAVQLLTYLL